MLGGKFPSRANPFYFPAAPSRHPAAHPWLFPRVLKGRPIPSSFLWSISCTKQECPFILRGTHCKNIREFGWLSPDVAHQLEVSRTVRVCSGNVRLSSSFIFHPDIPTSPVSLLEGKTASTSVEIHHVHVRTAPLTENSSLRTACSTLELVGRTSKILRRRR